MHNHIDVCICTYQRPHLLTRLLEELGQQVTNGLFSYSIVIVDNDSAESARSVVSSLRDYPVAINYSVESRRNIALARNAAIASAQGNFVAFIDDDELPLSDWLLTLFNACHHYNADGALGPVKPRFEKEPAPWVVKGKFHERPTYPTGLIIDWRKGRTGNTLLKKNLFDGLAEPFRPQFITGEDQDFFRRMIEKGHVFVWCDEAVAYEIVPEFRCRAGHMLRRALLRGKVSLRHPTAGWRDVAKSAVAVPLYAIALPALLVAGKHHFMRYVVKICDHVGRLAAALRFHGIREEYF